MALFRCEACRWLGHNPTISGAHRDTYCPRCESWVHRLEADWSWIKNRPEELTPDDVPVGSYVTVKIDNLCYGGPEEGGWWYDTHDPVEWHLISSPRVLNAVRTRCERLYSNEGRREISSVLSEGLYSFVIGRLPETLPIPVCKPHYE